MGRKSKELYERESTYCRGEFSRLSRLSALLAYWRQRVIGRGYVVGGEATMQLPAGVRSGDGAHIAVEGCIVGLLTGRVERIGHVVRNY